MLAFIPYVHNHSFTKKNRRQSTLYDIITGLTQSSDVKPTSLQRFISCVSSLVLSEDGHKDHPQVLFSFMYVQAYAD